MTAAMFPDVERVGVCERKPLRWFRSSLATLTNPIDHFAIAHCLAGGSRKLTMLVQQVANLVHQTVVKHLLHAAIDPLVQLWHAAIAAKRLDNFRHRGGGRTVFVDD